MRYWPESQMLILCKDRNSYDNERLGVEHVLLS
jgi:hypothetical protein